ncbi:glutamate receptor 2-like isoform X3 [Clavelina lepadiformis]|uniref:glutamate receptor 2-like isoform X3 n=1 Tax=Clavelina lepadiformis TaxID=159417 RepID=UPI004042290D
MITSWILLICVSVVIAVGAASNCCFRKPDLPDNSECLLQILLIYDDVNESSVVEPIQFLNNGDIMPNNWKVNIRFIHPVASLKDIVHISPFGTDPILEQNTRFPNLIRMSPSIRTQVQAYIRLMEYLSRTRYSVIYSRTDYGSSAWWELYLSTQWFSWKSEVTAYFEEPISPTECAAMLRDVKTHGAHVVLLISHADSGYKVLEKAYETNMTTVNGWVWFVMDAIARTPLKPFRFGNNQTRYFEGAIGMMPFMRDGGQLYNLTQANNDVKTLLDSILVVAHGYKTLCDSNININELNKLNASVVREKILAVNVSGFTSHLSFHKDGSTMSDELTVVVSSGQEWLPVGRWADGSLDMDDLALATSLRKVKYFLQITTIIEAPFVYFPNNVTDRSDMTKLRGFCIDVLEQLSRIAGFEYEIKLVTDGKFGGINVTSGSWNGMIGEVVRGEVDMAVASITVTQDRSDAVTFLPSFLDLGLKFILNTSVVSTSGHEYSPYAFLYPFHISLYCAVLTSVVLVAFFLCLLSMVSPYGIRGNFFLSGRVSAAAENKRKTSNLSQAAKRKLLDERLDAERGMGLNNALYFVWAALFWQTPEQVPRSVSARITTIAWYLSAVVFVASYTANMVSVVSRHDTSSSINSLTDLMIQTEVAYGTVQNSAVETQLQKSGVKLALKLYSFLTDDDDTSHYFVPSVEVGMRLVREEKFALLWDSVTLDFISGGTDCELKTVEVGFGAIEYAFALSKNSPHFDDLSRYMMVLKKSGLIRELRQKYLGKLSKCERDVNTAAGSQPKRLTFMDLAGMFYLVAFSMLCGVFLLVAEWVIVICWDVNKENLNAPQTMSEAFYRRFNRLADDIRTNWFPFQTFSEKWSRMTLSSQSRAENIINKKLQERKTSKTVSVVAVARLASSDTDMNAFVGH